MEGFQDTILGEVYEKGFEEGIKEGLEEEASRKTAEIYSNALADYLVAKSGGNLTKEEALRKIENIVSEYQKNTSTNSQNE